MRLGAALLQRVSIIVPSWEIDRCAPTSAAGGNAYWIISRLTDAGVGAVVWFVCRAVGARQRPEA
jgi:hypothetical protein